MRKYGLLINSTILDIYENFRQYKSFDFNYDRTTVTIKISDKAISISFDYKKKIEDIEKNLIYNPRFTFAIQKALSSFFMLNQKNIDIIQIYVYSKNSKNKIEELKEIKKEDFKVWNMIPVDCTMKFFGDNEKTVNFINRYISIKNSDKTYLPLAASLNAFLFAQSKVYFQSERFSYLWISMNGLMNFLYNIVNERINEVPLKFKKRPDENRQFYALLKYAYSDYKGESLSQNDRTKISDDIYKEIKNVNLDFRDLKNPDSDIYKIIMKELSDNKFPDNTPYEFVISDFAYYFRNKLFHANNPIPLIANINSLSVFVLEMVSNALEEFLYEMLNEFYTTDSENIYENSKQFITTAYEFELDEKKAKVECINNKCCFTVNGKTINASEFTNKRAIKDVKNHVIENIYSIKENFPDLFK